MHCFKTKWIAVAGAICLIGLSVTTAWAGGDHDHGEAATSSGGPALPRFAVESELFELVGVVNGKRITLYLDRYADGSPVKDAQLELTLDGVKVPVEAQGEGAFEAQLTHALKPGDIAVVATVMTGTESDLLAGELDLHDEATVTKNHRYDGREYLAWGIGSLAGLVLLIAIGLRVKASSKKVIGGVA